MTKRRVHEAYAALEFCVSPRCRFQGNLQQDAHEFCGDLLNALHDELFATFTRRAEEAGDEEEAAQEAGGITKEDQELHRNAGPYLPTVRRLHATISTTLECVSCGSSRDRLEDFLDLSVDFPTDKPATCKCGIVPFLTLMMSDPSPIPASMHRACSGG